MAARPVCLATRRDGAPCRAPAVPEGTLCWVHDPAWAERARAGRALGAVQAGKLRRIEGQRRKLDSPRALAGFLSSLVHDLVEGRVEPDLVRTVAYALSVQCKIIDLARTADVEQTLIEVRQLLAEARRRPA